MLGKLLKGWDGYATVPLRFAVGLGFIAHGLGKFGSSPGLDGFTGMLTGLGVPAPSFFAFLVALIELVGGAFVLLGLFTRYSSASLAVVIVFAIVLVKISKGFMAVWEPDLLYLAGALSLVFTGAGNWSIDEALGWDY